MTKKKKIPDLRQASNKTIIHTPSKLRVYCSIEFSTLFIWISSSKLSFFECFFRSPSYTIGVWKDGCVESRLLVLVRRKLFLAFHQPSARWKQSRKLLKSFHDALSCLFRDEALSKRFSKAFSSHNSTFRLYKSCWCLEPRKSVEWTSSATELHYKRIVPLLSHDSEPASCVLLAFASNPLLHSHTHASQQHPVHETQKKKAFFLLFFGVE